MSLSNSHRKLITSLSQKKYRQQHKLFVAEGVKVVEELLVSSFKLYAIFATEEYATDRSDVIRISDVELKKVSQLKSPNKVLAIFEIPDVENIKHSGLTVALDKINDPGNLGTIIRLCDWFGVEQLVCSKDTVDCFNQKVVQSSMGSLTRIPIIYTDLNPFLETSNLPVIVADMNGDNVYKTSLQSDAILVMGNEANGISEEVFARATHKISIPRFGNLQITESLNVATATAILLSEFRR